jgi:tetratricopeptide (TPR) repeat protein
MAPGTLQVLRAVRRTLNGSTRSLRVYREIGDDQGAGEVLYELARDVADRGDYGRARELFAESLEILRTLGDAGGVADALAHLAIILLQAGQVDEAEPLFEECLATYERWSDRWWAAEIRISLAECRLQRGDRVGATQFLLDALAAYRCGMFDVLVPIALDGLSVLAAGEERAEHAARLLGAAEGGVRGVARRARAGAHRDTSGRHHVHA